ncbi:pyridoxal phosphate-dependent transferase [Cladochytrium replicatum]|nr:pyridoxal phosphate-dependent transferase [Cladochytrium replicatum]
MPENPAPYPPMDPSFNVKELVELPPLPSNTPPKFGRACLDLFELDKKHLNLNHGSYGATPKYVRSYQRQLQKVLDSQPDLWFKLRAAALYDSTQKAIAPLLGGVPSKDIALVSNASFGCNSVFHSLGRLLRKHRPTDTRRRLKIIHLTTIYQPLHPVIKNCVAELELEEVEVAVNYPISDDDLVDAVKNAIDAADAKEFAARVEGKSSVCIAMIDAITSVPGVIVPFHRLTALFKSYGIWTFVDAAHAIGQITLDLSGNGPYGKEGVPEFFVTNCHKWLYAPVHSAVFYVDPKYQKDILPAVISLGYDLESFTDSFFWLGTLDQTAVFSIPAAINFRNWLGGEEQIRSYTHRLAIEGGKLLAQMFGTSIMGVPDTDDEAEKFSNFGTMVNVKLPTTSLSDEFMGKLVIYMLENYAMSCSPYKHNGSWWVRVSAQIYTELDDFKILGHALLKVLTSTTHKL